MSSIALVFTSLAVAVAVAALVGAGSLVAFRGAQARSSAAIAAGSAFAISVPGAMCYLPLVENHGAAARGLGAVLAIAVAALALSAAVFTFAVSSNLGSRMSAAWFGSPDPVHPFGDPALTHPGTKMAP